MSINWFPGHMHKAIKDIKDILPKVDLIIEVLDARIPYSSANPVIEQFRGSKPSLKVLSKSDLADPAVTQLWLDHFQKTPDVKAIAITTEQPEQIRGLTGVCKNLMGGKTDKLGNITALITGIPNVGKSTLINTLAGKVIAKTGNEPAITQSQQRIDLHNGLVLIDSPGILWPKIHNANSGYRLAFSGAIKNTAMDETDVAFFGTAYLLRHYPELMKQRFKLETLPELELEFLEIVGRQRGCLGGGGRVDLYKIAVVIINEFRTATLGRISLETPDMAVAEQVLVERRLAEQAAADAEKKKGRKASFQARKKT
ncbi:MAG TPA: ribosome biogenesis GTPase YlqF [Moraxellaceae bacterium]